MSEEEEKSKRRSVCFFNPENGNSVMMPASVLEDESKKGIVKAMIGMTGLPASLSSFAGQVTGQDGVTGEEEGEEPTVAEGDR